MSLLYMSWQRSRYRRAQLEMKNRLISLVQQEDEATAPNLSLKPSLQQCNLSPPQIIGRKSDEEIGFKRRRHQRAQLEMKNRLIFLVEQVDENCRLLINLTLSDGYGTEMKYMNKDRESKSSSICGTDKGQVGSNIATGVKSFTDLLKNAVLPVSHNIVNSFIKDAKRKVPKVKALDLAKETKKQEEEKKKQREMMKEKLERERERQKEEKAREEELNQRKKEEKERQRERLKEEKARQQELIQKRKEVEAQRKEAEMQERKRLREDEKKEKDRKMMRKEPQKKLPAGKEEKELKYRAADEKASTRKGFQDEDMKDLNPEKVKAREECAIGRQTQAKEPSGVHEHSVALKESHSNENAVNCFGQVNEVGSLATGGTLEQSYDISPYQGSDGEEDDDVPTRKVVPSWSRQCCLAPLSCSQQPKNIFKLSSFCDINQGKKSPEMSPYGAKDWVFGGFIVHELAEAARAQLEKKDRLIFLVEQAEE
ncbi:hypothetical protein C5167_034927, partial [Papaver somniferum]